MSVGMDMDLSGVSRSHVSICPEIKSTLKPEPERPRCASTPCSPIKGTVAGYQILHMDSNYLVGFTTGEELLKLAHKWSEHPAGEKGPAVPAAVSTSVQSVVPKSADLGVHRSSRIFKAKSRYYQPYDVPAANGRRRRRSMPSSRDTFLKTLTDGRRGKRAQLKSLDYLNLDKLNLKESSDTEVLQHQLQHLNLRGERGISKNKT